MWVGESCGSFLPHNDVGDDGILEPREGIHHVNKDIDEEHYPTSTVDLGGRRLGDHSGRRRSRVELVNRRRALPIQRPGVKDVAQPLLDHLC